MQRRRTSVPWTEREDALICRLRAKDCDYDDIASRLPHRTAIAVKRRVAHLITVGRTPSLRAPWTRKEDALLCALAAKDTPHADIAKRFERRTPAAVDQRLQHLRVDGSVDGRPTTTVSHRPWTSREESLLIALRARDVTLEEIARRLKRTPKAVAEHVKPLIESGIVAPAARSPHSRRPWSPEEDELVAAMRKADKTEPEIATTLGRTLASVRSRIAQRVRRGELEPRRVFAR